MKDAQICILGYGGWQDVVSTTVADTLGTLFGGAEVLWAFFEEGDRKILDKYRDPLERLASAPAFSQTTLFHGVDLHGMNWSGAPGVCAAPAFPPAAGNFPRVPDDLLERLRVAIEELLKTAPNHAKTKLSTLLKFDDILPDLCVVLAELCLMLKPITAKDQRRQFALTVLEAISALSACILKAGPRDPVARSARDKDLVVESTLMAELWVAATEWRALRVKRVVGQKKVIIRPAELAVDVDESAMLEWGPSETDYVRAFESRFWETLCPDAETYEQARDSAELNGKLRARKLLHQPLIGLISQKGPIPVDVLRGSFPHARFFIREASGANSCPIDEHTLAALLEELLTIAPELSPDVASTKESLL
jgi:hypothetical protein